MKKDKLAIFLSKLKKIESPKFWLEQYYLSSELAAEILNIAYLNNDIKNKEILDLGCGNGILAIGASKLGAKLCIGVDIDKDAIRVAKENSKELNNVFFVVIDIKNFFLKRKVDTIIQNPPFGLKSIRHMDRMFLEKAFSLSNKVYSLHRNGYKKTINFLENFAKKFGFDVEGSIKFKLDLFKIFPFHKSHKKKIEVRLYIFKKFNEI